MVEDKGHRHIPRSRSCEYCSKEYISTGRYQKYCSSSCKGKVYHYKNKERLNTKSIDYYYKNKKNINKKHSERYLKYRAVYMSSSAMHRAKKLNAIPTWINRKEITTIYKLACEKNLVVDHIVPLNSNRVCGLHCEDNLRCIPQKLNISKSNRYWLDM